ncbi:MAG: cobalamin biosynthesis protein CobD [Proteobacteria bacterium]|nr:cobalamin biosynthesis protein CobD [Pseudomonadota bacterium]
MLIATLPAAIIFAILLLAFMLDAAYGDPPWLYRRVPHPVALLGRVLEAAEVRWNRPGLGARARFLRGLLFVLAVVALAGGLGWAVERLCNGFLGGWVLEAVLASTLIAFRGLHDHVRAVAEALDLGLEDARAKVAHIVGRDPARLDQAGVARAATESLAENFSDGVVAPLFWFALFGLGGLCAYKAVNTLDSMIGYRNARFEAFGKAAARLDDALNWVPARLAGLLLVAAALILPKASAGRAWRTMRRDAPKHRSPNAGWQEAAMAGALGFALAGPRVYPDGPVADAWMGDGRAELGPEDLRAALRLYRVASALVAGLLAAAWVAG